MRDTVMEVNIDNFLYNLKSINEYTNNKKIMPIIKANAYGTYLNKRIDIINKFDIVGVALVSEAIELRCDGYKKEIFILNQPSINDIDNIIKYDLTISISSIEFLNVILKNKNKFKVHLEIETGMNRTGIRLFELDSFIEKIKSNNNIIVEGVLTHLSSASYDIKYTQKQLDLFHSALKVIKSKFNTIKYIHSCASSGILNFNDEESNLIRPGIILYGYYPFVGSERLINLKPTCTLKTRITFIKEIKKGESISYDRKFISKHKMKVATIPIGYADGLKRNLSNKLNVIINGKKVKILGNICMDSCIVDVSKIDNVKVFDEVYIWDNDNQSLEEVSNLSKTINYEFLSNISSRVPRIYKYSVKKTK